MPRPARTLLSLLVLVLQLAPVAARAQWPRPELRMAAGTTMAVTGEPDGGGVTVGAGLHWPLSDRFGFGVRVFADDLGTDETRLLDPNDGTDLGAVAQVHRWTYGAAWSGDYRAASFGRMGLDALGEFGYWREEADVRGRTRAASSAVGFTLGGAATWPLTGAHALAAVARYHRVLSARDIEFTRVDRYTTVALEWRWSLAPKR